MDNPKSVALLWPAVAVLWIEVAVPQWPRTEGGLNEVYSQAQRFWPVRKDERSCISQRPAQGRREMHVAVTQLVI